MDLERIERLVKLFGKSQARELHLESDGWRLSLCRESTANPETRAEHLPDEREPAEVEFVPADEGLVSITAPLVGIFRQGGVRLQPGDRVPEREPMGSIESMKILSPVLCPEGGEIAEVLVEDGQPVEYGHQLFLLRPLDRSEVDGGAALREVGRRGSWTLIELVVVMVIMVALAAWLLPRYLGTGKNAVGKNTIEAPIQRAQGVDCRNNLQQIRAAITMSEQTNEHFPASLNELTTSGSGITRDMLVCSESKQPYLYDPRTGQVGCPYPAHRGY